MPEQRADVFTQKTPDEAGVDVTEKDQKTVWLTKCCDKKAGAVTEARPRDRSPVLPRRSLRRTSWGDCVMKSRVLRHPCEDRLRLKRLRVDAVRNRLGDVVQRRLRPGGVLLCRHAIEQRQVTAKFARLRTDLRGPAGMVERLGGYRLSASARCKWMTTRLWCAACNVSSACSARRRQSSASSRRHAE